MTLKINLYTQPIIEYHQLDLKAWAVLIDKTLH